MMSALKVVMILLELV